jgi:hypothetical protein
MNDVYFRCEDCKIYIDAGFHWAAHTLEEANVVQQEHDVAVEKVLACNDYWETKNPKVQAILQQVAQFLFAHQHHRIMYGDSQFLFRGEGNEYLNWMYDTDEDIKLLPRDFVERLGFASWEEVLSYLNTLEYPPWWVYDDDDLKKVKDKFLQLVHEKQQCQQL